MLFRAIILSLACTWTFSMYISDPAKWNRHQYLVKVLTKDIKIGNISTCTGTLLSPSIVVTSAKCFTENRQNTAAQAIILAKGTKDTIHKAMLAVKIEGDLAVMKIDPVKDDDFCDKEPYPARVSRLNFKPSLTDVVYQSVEPKDIQDSRCRVVGFTTNDNVEKFASSHDVQVLELEVRADTDNLMFSEVNGNSTGRACWDDIGAPLECIISEDNKWVQVGLVHGIYGRGQEEQETEMGSNSTVPLKATCADVQTMQFVVFSDNTFAHAIEVAGKTSVFDAQDKCF
uniref:Peptidase S1 domain-containing protein n=1 Tax=Caenorhabditis japonica TaxID=281687 RepID=A0A8R1IYD2_CAEJA